MSHKDDIRARDLRIEKLEALVATLVEQNEALRAENEALRAENAALRERIEHLEYRLNLSSENSAQVARTRWKLRGCAMGRIDLQRVVTSRSIRQVISM